MCKSFLFSISCFPADHESDRQPRIVVGLVNLPLLSKAEPYDFFKQPLFNGTDALEALHAEVIFFISASESERLWLTEVYLFISNVKKALNQNLRLSLMFRLSSICHSYFAAEPPATIQWVFLLL